MWVCCTLTNGTILCFKIITSIKIQKLFTFRYMLDLRMISVLTRKSLETKYIRILHFSSIFFERPTHAVLYHVLCRLTWKCKFCKSRVALRNRFLNVFRLNARTIRYTRYDYYNGYNSIRKRSGGVCETNNNKKYLKKKKHSRVAVGLARDLLQREFHWPLRGRQSRDTR